MRVPEPSDDYARRLGELGARTLAALHALEAALRLLHPPRAAEVRRALAPFAAPLDDARRAFGEAPAGLEAFHARFARGAAEAAGALQGLLEPGPPEQAAGRVLGAMALHAHAQETLYPVRVGLPPLDRFFAEPPVHGCLERLEPAPGGATSVGHHRAAEGGAARERFCLYVPEWLAPGRPRPLVVALHGAMGSGREFLWTWLREARSRGFLLLAPSSRGTSWSLDAPLQDLRALRAMVAWVREHFAVDAERILLTGLSDGATFALLAGLAAEGPFTHLAPVSGVLHPANLRLGNLERAAGRNVYLVHGALDWLFPVGVARAARDALERAGAALVYREIEDLSHTYPREENDAILRWLDPSLVAAPPP